MAAARDDRRANVGHLDAMSQGEPRRAARDRIVDREVKKLERRAAAGRSTTRSQRDLVVASLLLRPVEGRGGDARLNGG
jgi:hypothetical protein